MNRIHKVTVRSNDNDKDDDKDNGNGNTNTNTNTNTNVTAGEKIGRGDPTTGNDDADRASAPRTIPGNRNSVGLQHQKEEQQQKQQQQKQQKPHRRHKRGWWKRKRKWSSSSSSCLLYPLVFGFGALYVFHLYKIVVILARHHHSHRQENPGIPKTVPGSLLRKNHAIATGKKKNTAEDSANDAVSHREVVVAAPTPPQNKANSEATTEMDHKHGHEQEHGHEHEHEHDHPIGNCAINLFGLPRSFGHHVLPSLVTNVLKPNRRYRCDWFVHFFNVTIEETDTEITAAEAKAKASALLSRGGNKGGTVAPQDVYLLRDAVRKEYEGESEGEIDENGRSTSTSSWSSSSLFGGPPTVHFVADTDRDFAAQRREWIDEIVWRNASSTSTSKSNSNSNSNSNHRDHDHDHDQNPYFVQEPSFTDRTLLNILKMWHSQDRVWNLMEETSKQHHQHHQRQRQRNKKYDRVAMLRLDVIYTTPIDIYKIPLDPIPEDYNEGYLQGLRRAPRQKKRQQKQQQQQQKEQQQQQQQQQLESTNYFYAWTDRDQEHCVLPGFKSFPVNDRYVAGPYEAVKLWANDRFGRARDHVTRVLPELERQRQHRLASETNAEAAGHAGSAETDAHPLTDFGLHDERFVAHTILPAIRKLPSYGSTSSQASLSKKPIGIQVDRSLYFVRVRADGSIWLRDKPGFGRVPKGVLEKALGRKCTGEPFEVLDEILREKSPGRWQIQCPPAAVDADDAEK